MLFTLVFSPGIFALGSAQTTPPMGIRSKTPDAGAFTNAHIIVSPTLTFDNGTLVIRVCGITDMAGTLERGKLANFFICEGDVLDPLTHNVVLEFIEGRRVDLDNKHKELNRKYRQKRFEPK